MTLRLPDALRNTFETEHMDRAGPSSFNVWQLFGRCLAHVWGSSFRFLTLSLTLL
jgi:hypothetical protein